MRSDSACVATSVFYYFVSTLFYVYCNYFCSCTFLQKPLIKVIGIKWLTVVNLSIAIQDENSSIGKSKAI